MALDQRGPLRGNGPRQREAGCSKEVLTGEVGARCQIVGGDFFDSVPEGADVYLLKAIIHDWPDDDAVKILRNIRRAMRSDGILLLVERTADSEAFPAGLMELLMLAIGGRERTEAEFRSLARWHQSPTKGGPLPLCADRSYPTRAPLAASSTSSATAPQSV
jgi:SAM-dependent methyltransferase